MNRIISYALFTLLSSTASAQQLTEIVVSNPSKTDRTDVPVVITLKEYGDIRSALITHGGTPIISPYTFIILILL